MITHEDVAKLRRYIAEPTQADYTDTELRSLIKDTAVADVNGNEPNNSGWIPTYDIFKAASDIWLEKAAMVADEFDFSSDGGTFQRSQKVDMYIRQASYFKSRSKATSLLMKQRPLEKLTGGGWQDLPYKDEIDDYEKNLK